MQIGIYSHFISKNNLEDSETEEDFLEEVQLDEADGVLHTEKSAIARVLNVHFSLIGDKLAMKIEEKLKSAVNKSKTFFAPTYSHSFSKENLFTFSAITESFGLKQLKALRTNKATG